MTLTSSFNIFNLWPRLIKKEPPGKRTTVTLYFDNPMSNGDPLESVFRLSGSSLWTDSQPLVVQSPHERVRGWGTSREMFYETLNMDHPNKVREKNVCLLSFKSQKLTSSVRTKQNTIGVFSYRKISNVLIIKHLIPLTQQRFIKKVQLTLTSDCYRKLQVRTSNDFLLQTWTVWNFSFTLRSLANITFEDMLRFFLRLLTV